MYVITTLQYLMSVRNKKAITCVKLALFTHSSEVCIFTCDYRHSLVYFFNKIRIINNYEAKVHTH